MTEKEKDWDGWTDKGSTQKADQEFFETPLEYEKYLLDPKNEKVWKDINKDLSLGNLGDMEYQAVLNQEKTLRGLLGMKDSLDSDVIGQLFVPDNLLKLYRRMPAFTLALSLSKQGFKQNLMRSFTKEQILTAREETSNPEYKRGWFPKKKSKEGQ